MKTPRHCDQIDLEGYLSGELYDEGCQAVEEHVRTCEACLAKIEAALAPVEQAVKKSFPIEAVPSSLKTKLAAFRPNRPVVRLRWGLAMACTTLALMTGIGYIASSTIELTFVEGLVLADGRQVKSGDRVFRGALLTAIDPARIRFGSEEIRFLGVWSQCDLRQLWGKAEAADFVTPAFPSHTGSQTRATYRVGATSIETLGTRFGIVSPVLQDPTIAVMEHEVRITRYGKSEKLREGSAMGSKSLADDDPTRIDPSELVFVPGLGDRPATSIADDPLPSMTQQVLRAESIRLSQDPSSHDAFLSIARALTEAQEHAAAGWAMRRAIELDSMLRSAKDEELMRWMAWQAGYGSSGVQEKLFKILSNRRAKFDLVAWKTMLADEENADKLSAAWRLFKSTEASLRIPCAWLAFRQIGAKAIYRKELEDIAKEMARLAATNSVSSDRERALALSVRAECLYYRTGREAESLVPLEEANKLWTTRDRTIHLMTRFAEAGQLERHPEAKERLKSAFFAEPTYRNAQRVLLFLQTAARTPNDQKNIFTFARWMGETFPTLVPAQMAAAGVLQELSPQVAVQFVRQALDIVGNKPSLLPSNHARLAAQIEWLAKPDKSLRRRSELASRFLLSPGETHEQEGLSYFFTSEDFASALKAIERDPRMDRQARFLIRARALAGLGRAKEAVTVLKGSLKGSFNGGEPMDVAEAKVLIAEQLAKVEPRVAIEEAKKVLAPEAFAILEVGWRKYRRYDLMFRARAYAVLGQYAQAALAQKEFLARCMVLPDRYLHLKRLANWERRASVQDVSP